MDRLRHDLRFAVRALQKRPVFALVAAGSLALGIGANTALFSAVNGLLLRPLPGISDVDRVVELGRGRDGSGFDTFSYPDFRDIRDQVPALGAVAAVAPATVSLAQEGEGLRGLGIYVSPAYFQVLGLAPDQGRFFGATEADRAGPDGVVVLSWGFWQRSLGGDPEVVGSTLRLNREPFTVIGILPRDFRGHMLGFGGDVYLPITRHPEYALSADNRRSSWHLAVGRLAPEASLEQLGEQLRILGVRLAEAHPESNARRTFAALPLGPVPGAGRGPVSIFLAVLMGMVVLVLLVTCANVAGMFLARAATREREVAVRLALGAGRGGLVRQLTVETLLVFVLGGGVGLALAAWVTGLIRPDLLPLPVTLDLNLTPDGRVVAFSVLATLLTGLVFGLLPAWQATRLDLVARLKEGGGAGGTGPRGGRLRRAFVTTQVGLSLVLLVAAGLFLRSLQRASQVDTGFDPTDTYMTSVDLSLEGYDRDQGVAFLERLRTHLQEQGWVRSVALATDLPLDLSTRGTVVVPEGWPGDASDPGLGVDFNQVSPGYFGALGIALEAGRDLAPSDGPGTEAVAVVSRTFARQAWPDGQALGRSFLYGSFDPERGRSVRVVGVVDDVKNAMITDAAGPFVYTPLAQNYASEVQVVVRADGGLAAVAPRLRQAVLALDPSLSLAPVVSVERYTSLGTLPQRLAAGLTTSLGLLALLLSGLGVYGVVAFAVTHQTREIGLRMALGAGRGRVLARVLHGGLSLAWPGLLGGAVLAALAGRVLRGFLLGLSPVDPLALGGVVVALSLVVGVATLVPARRAVAVDPAVALRGDG